MWACGEVGPKLPLGCAERDAEVEADSSGMSNIVRKRSITVGCSVVGTLPIRVPAPRASGSVPRGSPSGRARGGRMRTRHTARPASRRRARRRRDSDGAGRRGRSKPSSWRFAHHASWYSEPNSRIVARSSTTRKRAICWLPPFGAFAAASTIRWMSSNGIASGFKRRIERWVNIASPSGIDSRMWSMGTGSCVVTRAAGARRHRTAQELRLRDVARIGGRRNSGTCSRPVRR